MTRPAASTYTETTARTRLDSTASIDQRTCTLRFHKVQVHSGKIIVLVVFTQWLYSLVATAPQPRPEPPNGGNGVIRGTTRRRHTVSQLLMLQNPHQHRRGGRWRARLRRPWAAEARQLDTWKAQRRDKTRPTRTAPGHCDTKLALHTPSHRMSGTKLALHTPSHRMCGIKLALLAQNGPNWHVFRAQGELYTAVASKKPRRANFIPHTRQRRG